MVGTFLEPSCGRRLKPIHSILYSVAQPLERGSNNYYSIIQGSGGRQNPDAANYTVKEGSTIVTLKAEYLETLSVGKHTLAIVSDTGTAAAEFTIQTAPATDNARYYTCQSCGHHD